MAWTDAARAAALETRRANAAAKQRQNTATNRAAQMKQADMAKKYPQGAGKPGPQTDKHPNAGNRVAFALRNKQIHDAGKDARIAAHQRQVMLAAGGHFAAGAGKALLGLLIGAGGKIVGDAIKGNLRNAGRR